MIEGLTALCQQYYFQSYSRRRPVFAHSHMFQFKSRFILVTKAPKLIIWGARAPARLTNYMKSFMGNRVRNHLVTLLIVNTTALTIDYHIQISVRDRAEHIEQKMTWESRRKLCHQESSLAVFESKYRRFKVDTANYFWHGDYLFSWSMSFWI